MKNAIHYLSAAMLALTLTVSNGAIAQHQEQAFAKAQESFQRALRGSEKDNEAAAEQFKQLSAADPGNPLYSAYYGSTFTLKARDAWAPWNKLKLGEQGLDLIDKSLKRLKPEHDRITLHGVPVGIETRLVAVSTYFQLPDRFFHRYDSGKALLAETMKSPQFIQSPPQIQARFHAQAALAAKQDGRTADEVAQLQRALQLDASGKNADSARARLKELGA